MPIQAADRRGGIVADREPGLGKVSHLKIVRRSGTADLGRHPARIDSVAQDIRPAPSDGEGQRSNLKLAF
jgi:hypothetical protein